MLPAEPDNIGAVERARLILDRFDVAGRLQHVRQFIWRGGHLQFQVDPREAGHQPDVCYALVAEWAAPVLERSEPSPGPPARHLQRASVPVIEGRWVRGTSRYVLRVGLDLAVPSAIYIRSDHLLSYVPFLGRAIDQVENAVNADLSAYVNAFLANHQPVPQAMALDAQRLRRLGLADQPRAAETG